MAVANPQHHSLCGLAFSLLQAFDVCLLPGNEVAALRRCGIPER